MQEAATDEREAPAKFADRYSVELTLGKGGMATVYRVRDSQSGRTLALKRLTPTAEPQGAPAAELFEHEFHTLSELAHPRVIEVYDYFKDADGSFYTMELLEGGDLREGAPLPWRRVASVLRDVCSALSLLHSRRLVHRDLTPRNVRCTTDGKGKLIDFGAMARVGPCKQIVGTPSFIAPEAQAGQVVDARTDLFSLGATAYYAITGRHAYPARTLVDAREAWKTRPPPPSHHSPDVPKALDDLVLALLQLKPVARPGSAAEVIERLEAIAGLPPDAELTVHRAYLNDPTLVGRDDELAKVKRQILRTEEGRGGAFVVLGEPGVGRSRFLDACALEAKLAGATVLRTDAADAASGAWGAAEAIAAQLVRALPEVALRAAAGSEAILRRLVPELGSLRAGRSSSQLLDPELAGSPQKLRLRTMEALKRFVLGAAEETPLVLLVDDLERVDEPSAALFALLASATAGRRAFLLATADPEAGGPGREALSLFVQASASIKLRPLPRELTFALLESVFGSVPGVQFLSDRLHTISSGKPRDIMQVSQHLVDTGVARYEAGKWTLPDRVDPADLPATVGDALARRVEALGPAARELATAFALTSKEGFTTGECAALVPGSGPAELKRAIDALSIAEIVTGHGRRWSLRHPSWASVLVRSTPPDRARELHRRLGEALLTGPVEERFRAAYHLLQAGERGRALDAALEHLEAATACRAEGLERYFDFVRSLPSTWFATCEELIRVCEEERRPVRQEFRLRFSLVSLGSVTARMPVTHLAWVAARLREQSGLDAYAALGDAVEPSTRIAMALGGARQRFDALPEHDRVLSPAEAIQYLAQLVLRAIGLAGRAMDHALLGSMPSLEPFAPLSPAVAIVEQNRKGTMHLLAGRTDETRAINLAIVERMDQEDGGGLGGTDHVNMRLSLIWAVANIDVQAGVVESVRYADVIEKSPLFEVNACRLRLMNAVRQGQAAEAERLSSELEVLRIQNRPPQLFEGSYLSSVTMGYGGCQDLLRVKEMLPGLDAMAKEIPAWQACSRYGRALYQSLRGNSDGAIEEATRGLETALPGRHLMWAPIAGLKIAAYLAADRHEEAKALADEYLAAADEHRLGTISTYLRQPAALVEAAVGNFDRAAALADGEIARFEKMGGTGVPIGSAYETRARVAIAMNDPPAYAKHAALAARHYHVGEHPSLTAKFERLLEDARRAGVAADEEAAPNLRPVDEMATRAATLLGTARGPVDRAKRVLALLVEESGTRAGFLYTMQREGPVLVAEHGGKPLPEGLDTAVQAYVERALAEAGEATVMTDAEDRTNLDLDGFAERSFQAVLLGHRSPAGYAITGAALLELMPDQKWRAPNQLVTALSKSLLEAGDVATVFMAE